MSAASDRCPHGELFAVDAAATSGAIGFTGIVDTTADTFTLLSVTDGAGGLDFWTISAPIVMTAQDAGGAYDVPDAWDGTIDATWGFVGPLLSASPSTRAPRPSHGPTGRRGGAP